MPLCTASGTYLQGATRGRTPPGHHDSESDESESESRRVRVDRDGRRRRRRRAPPGRAAPLARRRPQPPAATVRVTPRCKSGTGPAGSDRGLRRPGRPGSVLDFGNLKSGTPGDPSEPPVGRGRALHEWPGPAGRPAEISAVSVRSMGTLPFFPEGRYVLPVPAGLGSPHCQWQVRWHMPLSQRCAAMQTRSLPSAWTCPFICRQSGPCNATD